ncbi:MAG: non-canonical purine NTP pyrophosphatase [Candidatus Diapherotrites archaeon]|nr:non-canonical purine NTP pyrophosphatase [Candidatus Diapherotrites archaeon]
MLHFVSTNRHKFTEIKRILAKHGIKLRWHRFELHEPSASSLEQIALEKAKQAYAKLQKPLIVEDTGIFFEGFTNFPGAQAKRVYERIGFEGLLSLISKKSRRAYFKTVICFTDGKQYKLFSGKLEGKLTQKVYCKDKDVLPYEKIFIPKGFDKPLCMIAREKKNEFSHRAKAAEKFASWLKKTANRII